jgi:uncharacterized protein (TIGR02147 family)
MPNIFDYMDYREFLEDFYQEKKAHNPHFSFQLFAEQAGFGSKSFIKLVIDGKKNLGDQSLEQLNRALKLNDKAFAFFKDLVSFNQASSLQLRNFYFEKLVSYNKRSAGRLLLQQQYDFYSKWYHNTIRELVVAVDFHEDYENLARLVKPAITARKARQSVELLLKLGLIRKKTGGGYEQVDTVITTGDEVRSLAVQNFHQQNLALASQTIDTVKSSQRDISCLVLGLSQEGFRKAKSEIQQFRKKLLQIAQDEKTISSVYHVQFNLFPTSESLDENPEDQ